MTNRILLIIVLLVGCVSPKVEKIARRNSIRTQAYVKKMKNGETTPEENELFIMAQEKAWVSFDYYFNGNPPPDHLKLEIEERAIDEQ